uniref:EGF-like domain-containing protein n=1 Tax=Globodera rostochiensis TaxID=31243 RepID=A0A914GWF0_GLORO
MAMIALTFSSATWSLLCILPNLLIIAHFLPSNAASHYSSPSPSSSPRSLCNPREDSLFLADSTDRQAFFQCRSLVELPSIGFWERHFCPNDMHFAYGTQQCTANSLPPEVVREANELFRIAILNGSCANGERCIGGTVCDRTQHRCLCPYGTVAVLENLYCEKISRQHPEQQWRGHQQQQLVHPPYGVFHVAQPQNQMNVVGGTPFAALFATVAPGSSCAQGELCGGGSVCLPSHGICVCPQGMENYAGRCVDKSIIPNGAKFERNSGQTVKEFLGSRGGFIKASLGERCNDYFGEFCADQSAFCKEGRCRCVVSMVELNGRCQKLPREETGPGEPCNGGQECVKGTVCHQKMGVCVCSEGNELKNGLCVEKEGEAKLGEAEITTTTTTTTEAAGAVPVMVSISSAEVTTSALLKANRKSGESTVGKKCSLNAECLSGAYCNGNSRPPTCQCISTHVNVNDRCEKVIYPGQRGCETDLQCSAGYAGTRCIGRQCVCPPGSTAIDRTCIPAIAWPGEACNITRLMPVCSADSYCFEGRCVCNPPTHLFQKQCIHQREGMVSLIEKAEEIGTGREDANGDECSRDEQCREGFSCTPKRKCERCGRVELSKLGENCNKARKDVLSNEREDKEGKKEEKRVSEKVTDFGNRTNPGGAMKTKESGVPIRIGQTEKRAEEPPQIGQTEKRAEEPPRIGQTEKRAEEPPQIGQTEKRAEEPPQIGQTEKRAEEPPRIGQTEKRAEEPPRIGQTEKRAEEPPRIGQTEKRAEEPPRIGQTEKRAEEPPRIGQTEKRAEEPPRIGQTEKMSGMEQIFSTLALLKSAALDGVRRRGKLLLQNDALMKMEDGGRKRRESKNAPMWTNTEDMKQGGLPHNHRLEGEPCSPGDFCLQGAECVDGHCRCPSQTSCKYVPTFRPIGSECIEGRDRCMGGSICRNSSCICTDGSFVNVEKMRCRQSPGGRCTAGQICSEQSECRFGTCQCRVGMKLKPLGERQRRKCILAVAYPGQSCRNGENCIGESACGPGEICLCPSSHKIVNGSRCKPSKEEKELRDDFDPSKARKADKERRREKSKPGESCAGDELCTGGSFCSEKSICICAPGERVQMLSGGAKNCVLVLGEMVKAEPGQLCVEDGMECAGGAKCQNGLCTCPEGHTLFRNECLPPRALPISVGKIHAHTPFFSPETAIMDSPSTGSDFDPNLQDPIPSKTVSPGAMCRLSLECPYRTECLRAVCRCQRRETIVNGMCRKTIHDVLPGGRCDTQKGLDCVGESHCFYGICVCLYGLVIIGNECANVNVLERVAPGKRCVPGQHCLGKSKCLKGKCQCAKGQKIDTELRRCVKISQPASVTTRVLAYPSEAEVVAGPTSIVEIPLGAGGAMSGSDGRGKKPAKFIYAIPAALAAAAEDGKFQQILTANQMSINLLDQNMRPLLTKLIEQQKRNDEAIGKEQKMQNFCSGESSANCQQQRKTLQPFLLPDSLASTYQQLLQPAAVRPDPASPRQNTNQPGPDLTPLPQHFQQSIPDPASSISLFHQLSSMKSPPHLQGQPGHFCASGNICHGGAICLAGLCICRPGFKPNDGICQIAKVNLGEQCFLDEQCKANGFCIDGVCHCRAEFDGMRSSFGRNVFRRHRCPTRPVAAAGEDCSKSQACGWNSICGKFTGVCECAVGMQSNQGACVAARRPPGTECLSSSNCHKSAFCDNGFCLCKVGFEYVDGFCLPPARPVVDDSKVYIDPATMALMLKKKRTEEAQAEGEARPFGLKFARQIPSSGRLQAVFPPTSGEGNLPAEEGEETADDSLPGDSAWNTPNNALPSGGIASLRPPFSSRQTQFFERRFGLNGAVQLVGQKLSQQFIDGQSGHQQHFSHSQRRSGITPSDQNLFPPEAQQQQFHFTPHTPPPMQHFPAHPNARTSGTKTMELTKGKAGKNKAQNKETGGQGGRSANHRKQPPQRHGVAMPGEYCGTRELQCLGNSICLKGWCQCPEGVHVERGGMCANEPGKSMMPSTPTSPELLHHKLHRPFDSCFSNRPCIHGASCVRSAALLSVQKLGPFCQCSPGLIFLQDKCIPRRPEVLVAKPGERCRPPAIICDKGSVCGEESICKCPANRNLITGLCVHLALPGESCADGEFCAGGAICAPGLSACVCQVGWNVRSGKCRKEKKLRKLTMKGEGRRSQSGQTIKGTDELPPATPMAKLLILLGESCHFDSECANVLNAHCASATRRCVCLDGFFELYSSICVPEDRIRLPGEECISSAHFCAKQSWCKNGRCACIQRDSHAVEGHCVHKLRTKWTIRRQPPKGQSTSSVCSSEEHCSPGAVCSAEGQCECNGRILGGNKSDTDWTEKRCRNGTDCPRGLRCLEGKCLCSKKARQKKKPHTKMVMNTESSRKERREKIEKDKKGNQLELEVRVAEADLEWDYALGEPVFGGGGEHGRHLRPHQRHPVPILPGTFCDAFSRCGEGSECFFGQCQCIFRGQRLAFVDGVTKCVGDERESGNEDTGEETNTEGRQKVRRRRVPTNPFVLLLMDSNDGQQVEKDGQPPEAAEKNKDRRGIWRKNLSEATAEDSQANTDAKNCSAQPKHSISSEVQWKPQPSSSTRQRQKSSTGRKVFVPGALCGPLDICIGGSSCVEGFCLCPAGTRPSPTSGNCETFAQQRKTSMPAATTERKLRRGDTELNTAPAPIGSINQISTKSSQTVPATEPSILSSPLTDGPLDHNRNNSGKMRMLTSFTTDGKEFEILSTTLFRNGTGLSALRDVRAKYGTNPSVGVRAYNSGDEVKDSTTSEPRGGLINPKSVRRTLLSLERAYARPSESCSGAEICTGGSICDRNNKVCECPAVKPILRNHICIRSDEPPMIKAKEVKPGDFCNSETKCMGNSVCAEGSCRCQRGFRLKDVHCMGGQDSDSSGVLPPVRLSPEKELQQQSNDSPHPVSSAPQRLRSHAKPRISGPPLRRTTSSPVLSLAPAGTKGVCPPGNSPLTDQSTGLLTQCNGMRPNCPPKSYCFVTGVASEVYNCCKSY